MQHFFGISPEDGVCSGIRFVLVICVDIDLDAL
jgi:hypothetical protein